jgi:GNAT superfamily N-acetyltransferase
MPLPDGLRIEWLPPAEEIAVLEERLYQYNAAKTGYTDGQTLSLIVRDADGTVVGGIHATTWAGWLDIRLLWIDEAWRGCGLGGQLLGRVEDEAIRRGCCWAAVETHRFQAPMFYQRHGYSVYATLEGYPPGHAKLFLKKCLLAAPDTGDAPS